jgi:hypothetical protein
MKYLVLLYQDETIWSSLDDAERNDYMEAHMAFDRAVSEGAATMLGGEALSETDTATTLRHDDDDRLVLTDGPFAETTEQLGGYYLVEAADLDVMTTIAQELPHGYTVEIRPVVDMGPVFDEVPAARSDSPAGA